MPVKESTSQEGEEKREEEGEMERGRGRERQRGGYWSCSIRSMTEKREIAI